MIVYPTMSKSALLLQCSYPFSVPGGFTRELPDDEAGEGALFGLDFHAVMNGETERAGKTIGEGVREHARKADEVLSRWLDREGWTARSVKVESEQSYVLKLPTLDPHEWSAARCKSPTEDTHTYPGHGPRELRGTADRVYVRPRGLERKRALLVVDYKTGVDASSDFIYPSRLPQLRSLGLAAGSVHRAETVQHALLHAPIDGEPIVYADSPEDANDTPYVARLHEAFDRIEDESMRVGPECTYCPARDVCPTRGAKILDRADAVFQGLALRQSELVPHGNDDGAVFDRAEDGAIESWDARLGRLYALTKLAEDTAKEIRKRLAEERKKGHLPVVPDEDWVPPTIRGKVLDFTSRTYRNLSIGGIEKALGKAAADKEIERLTELGAIQTVTREELRPVND